MGLEVIRLILFIVCGMVLAVLYRISMRIAYHFQGRRGPLIALGLSGGALLLAAVILFVVLISGGKLGLYSIPVIILGFYLYHRILAQRVESFLAPIGRALGHFFGGMGKIGTYLSMVIFWPLDKLIAGVESLCRLIATPYRRHRQNRSRRKRRREPIYEQEEDSW